jgi:hypothetical protein
LARRNLGESDERSVLRAPPSALRCSPPHKSPPPGTAHRAVTLVMCFGERIRALVHARTRLCSLESKQ